MSANADDQNNPVKRTSVIRARASRGRPPLATSSLLPNITHPPVNVNDNTSQQRPDSDRSSDFAR